MLINETKVFNFFFVFNVFNLVLNLAPHRVLSTLQSNKRNIYFSQRSYSQPEDLKHHKRLNVETNSVDLNNTDIIVAQRNQLSQLLQANRDVFGATDDELGQTSLVQHHIDTGNA